MKLVKLHSVGFTSVMPIIGAASTGELDVMLFFELFFIGVLVHIFGFAMNEHRDVEVDRLSKALSDKPLVKGTISPRKAFVIYQSAWVLALILNFAFFREPISLFLLAVSVLFGALYNLASKRYAYPEVLLALWAFFFVLSGAAAVDGEGMPGYLGIAVAGTAFFQILFNTGISGAFKDIDHDPVGKGATTPLRLGVRVRRGMIHMTGSFIILTFMIKALQAAVVFLPLLLHQVPSSQYHLFLKLTALVLLSVIVFYLIKDFLSLKEFRRKRVLAPLAAIEVFSYMMTPVMLLGVIGYPELALLSLYPFLLSVPLVPVMYGRIIPNV